MYGWCQCQPRANEELPIWDFYCFSSVSNLMAEWCFKLSPDHLHTPPVSIPVTYLSIRCFISAVIKTHKFRSMCPLYAVRSRDVTPGIVVYQQFWFRTYINKFTISRTYPVRMLRIEHIGIIEFISSCTVYGYSWEFMVTHTAIRKQQSTCTCW